MITNCYTKETKTKHKHLREFAKKYYYIVDCIRGKYSTRPCLYIDLNSGLGVDPSGDKCSPLIFYEESKWFEQNDYYFSFVENDEETFEILLNACVDAGIIQDVSVIWDDNLRFSESFCINEDNLTKFKNSFGIVFADPIGAGKREFQCLHEFSHSFPRLDLLIYLQAASIKRQTGRWGNKHGFMTLEENMSIINKRYFYVREPHEEQQYSLMLCTNWSKFDLDLRELKMCRTDTPEGKLILERLTNEK